MAKQPQDKSANDSEQEDRRQRGMKIGDHVLRQLGQPIGLHGLQIRWLWNDYYRVNVLVGADFVNAKVAHSYFVFVDSDCNILSSSPQITQIYRPYPSSPAPAQADAPSIAP